MSLKLWFSKDFISSFSAMLSLLNDHTGSGIRNEELDPPTYFLHCRIFLSALHLEAISFLPLPPALLGVFWLCFPSFLHFPYALRPKCDDFLSGISEKLTYLWEEGCFSLNCICGLPALNLVKYGSVITYSVE